jgi:hypothetical protein
LIRAAHTAWKKRAATPASLTIRRSRR